MGTQPDWVKSVGDAFLASPEDVMDTVQKLRKKALASRVCYQYWCITNYATVFLTRS
jgi:hypothetical protein